METAKKLTGEVMHCFELRTANVDFFVGEDTTSVSKTLPTTQPEEIVR